MLQVVDNFFNDLDFVLKQSKQMDYFSSEKLMFLQGHNQSWPGERTLQFSEVLKNSLNQYQSLHDYTHNNVLNKFNFNNTTKNVKYVFHKRFEKDNGKDWIHRDASDFALIVYLSDTNLNSGTTFYNDDKKETMTINFVQNRAIFFNSKILHTSKLNYGSKENCRLTLNGFIWL